MFHTRTILHADMDAFYASIEQRDHPELRGKPVAVGGKPPRGVVMAASYEARPYGVMSAIPTGRALQACPQLIVLPPQMERYARVSAQLLEIFRRMTPLVEPLSLDEAFLDLTGTETLHGTAVNAAKRIKASVRDELSLTVSIGIGHCKFIAKIASDLDKPDGLVVVSEDEVRAFLASLPVKRIWGIGKVGDAQLERLGVRTIGELAELPKTLLTSTFGKYGGRLWELAHGIDNRPVVPDGVPKSIGHEDTFEKDLTTAHQLKPFLCQQADRVAQQLRRKGYWAQTVVLKIKTSDFKIRTRRRKLDYPTRDGIALGNVACVLLESLLPTLGPIRLIGVSVTGLIPEFESRQLSLDEHRHDKREHLGQAIDAIETKFGAGTIVRGTLNRPPTSNIRRQLSTEWTARTLD